VQVSGCILAVVRNGYC